MSRALRGVVLLVLFMLTSCGTPPEKEMNQAQGAIDAARAAGAEAYAPTQFKSAVDALDRAQQAVDASDYRLALNHALDSREQAQEAAKQAAAQKAIVRSEAERELNRVEVALKLADQRLDVAGKNKVPARVLDDSRRSLENVAKRVQEAREALAREDYLASRAALKGLYDEVEATSGAIDAASAPKTSPRRR